jgi:hypothetical protein
MLKKLTLTIVMLTCALSASIPAQTTTSSEKQAAIKELVFLINGDNKTEEIMNAIIPQLQAQQDAALKSSLDNQTDLTAADKQSLYDSFASERKYSVKRLMDKMMQKLNYNELLNEISSTLLDKYYTLEEVKDLTTFYKTPTGLKSLKMMAPMMTDTMLATQEKVMPKMMVVMKEIMDEDKAEIEQKIIARKSKSKKKAGK